MRSSVAAPRYTERWDAEYGAALRRSFFRRYPDIEGDDLKKAEEFFREVPKECLVTHWL